VVYEEVVSFDGFLECLEDDAGDLSLVESECSVIGTTYQVVGEDVLNDSQWTSHGKGYARSLPTSIHLQRKVL